MNARTLIGATAPSILIGLLLTGCATTKAPPAPSQEAIESVTVFDADTVLKRVVYDLKNNRPQAANDTLVTLIEEEFDNLSAIQQHHALFLEAVCALQLREFPRALTLAQTSSALPDATAEDWALRLQAATANRDLADAAISLTHLARLDTRALNSFKKEYVMRLVSETAKLSDTEIRYNLLYALYDARYVADVGTSSDYLWYSLALLMLEKGEMDQAADVINNLHNTLPTLFMRVDKRFAAFVAANPQKFDMKRVAAAEVEYWQQVIDHNPRSLSAVYSEINALLVNQQYEQALQVADAAMEKIELGTPESAFDDADTVNWLANIRATALSKLGQFDAASKQMQIASEALENGHANVSQLLNLAEFQVVLKRPQEALDTLQRLSAATSGYGKMTLENIRHLAAIQMNNAAERQRSMVYIAEHRSDAPAVYVEALLDEGDLDSAAQVVIQNVTDPKERAHTLASWQTYQEGEQTPVALERSQTIKRLMSREDMQTVFHQYGVIETFAIDRPPGI